MMISNNVAVNDDPATIDHNSFSSQMSCAFSSEMVNPWSRSKNVHQEYGSPFLKRLDNEDDPEFGGRLHSAYELRGNPLEPYMRTAQFEQDARDAIRCCMRGEGVLDPIAQAVFFTPRHVMPVADGLGTLTGSWLEKITNNVALYGQLLANPQPVKRGKDAEPSAFDLPAALIRDVLSHFDSQAARVVVGALDIVKCVDDGLDPENRDLERYFWRNDDGVYVELTDTQLSKLLHAIRTGISDRAINAAIALIKESAHKIDCLDAQRYVAIDNGRKLIDLEESTPGHVVIVPCPDDVMPTNSLPFDYDEDVFSEDAEKFFDGVANHDPATRALMEEAFGTALTSRFIPMVFLCGDVLDSRGAEAANGKSKMMSIVQDVVGVKNTSQVPLREFSKPFTKVALRGKTANFDYDASSDIISRDAISEGKKLSGGDLIFSDKKYDAPVVFKGTVTQFIASNTLPRIAQSDMNGSIDRRFVFVPFLNHFVEGSPDWDPTLADRVKDSSEAKAYVFKRLVHGLLRLIANGGAYTETDFSHRLKSSLREENDSVARWLSEDDLCLTRAMVINEQGVPGLDRLVRDDDRTGERNAWMLTRFNPDPRDGSIRCNLISAWYIVYRTWCRANGVKELKQSQFTKSMKKYLGLDSDYNASWTLLGDDGKLQRRGGRCFTSNPDYKSYASGLDLPRGDAIGIDVDDNAAELVEYAYNEGYDIAAETDAVSKVLRRNIGYDHSTTLVNGFSGVKQKWPRFSEPVLLLPELVGREEGYAGADTLRSYRDGLAAFRDFVSSDHHGLDVGVYDFEFTPTFVARLRECVGYRMATMMGANPAMECALRAVMDTPTLLATEYVRSGDPLVRGRYLELLKESLDWLVGRYDEVLAGDLSEFEAHGRDYLCASVTGVGRVLSLIGVMSSDGEPEKHDSYFGGVRHVTGHEDVMSEDIPDECLAGCTIDDLFDKVSDDVPVDTSDGDGAEGGDVGQNNEHVGHDDDPDGPDDDPDGPDGGGAPLADVGDAPDAVSDVSGADSSTDDVGTDCGSGNGEGKEACA